MQCDRLTGGSEQRRGAAVTAGGRIQAGMFPLDCERAPGRCNAEARELPAVGRAAQFQPILARARRRKGRDDLQTVAANIREQGIVARGKVAGCEAPVTVAQLLERGVGLHRQCAVRPQRDEQRQRHDAAPTGGDALGVAASFAQPAEEQIAPVGQARHLRRVERFTGRAVGQDARRVGVKYVGVQAPRVIEGVEQVVGASLRRDDQRLLLAKVQQVGAFPDRAGPDRRAHQRIAVQQHAQVFPLHQVRRAIVQHAAARIGDVAGNDQMPAIVRPPDKGVAEVAGAGGAQPCRRPGDNRVVRRFRPRCQIGAADCSTDDLGHDAGVEQRGDAVMVDGAARPAAPRIRAAGRRRQRQRQVAPVDAVVADGMAPVDRAMKGAVRVVLVKEMHLSPPVDQAIRIVHPVGWREEMEVGPVRIAGQCGAAWKVRLCCRIHGQDFTLFLSLPRTLVTTLRQSDRRTGSPVHGLPTKPCGKGRKRDE